MPEEGGLPGRSRGIMLLELLDRPPVSEDDWRRLLGAFDARREELASSRGDLDRGLVERAEAEVCADPASAIRFSPEGFATVTAAGRHFAGGRFELPSLGELRRRVGGPAGSGRLRLWVLEGASPVTDIGALQATAPPNTLFQVASQFNCLEAMEPQVTDVADYFKDNTQGPRAAISAFPGTLVRHYAAPAPEGGRFVQSTDGRQLNLLEGLAPVRNGYLKAGDIPEPQVLARELEARFDEIRVGVHEGIEVVLGANWYGPVEPGTRISQAFTSTLAAGGYGRPLPEVCRPLLRAAYLGTLLAAAVLGQERVVLTLIGGGAFGNPVPMVWESLLAAADEVAPLLSRDLTVILNGRNLPGEVQASEWHRAARDRGGALIHCGGPRARRFQG